MAERYPNLQRNTDRFLCHRLQEAEQRFREIPAESVAYFTVSRLLAEWERLGIVKSRREAVVLRNVEGLAQMSAQEVIT